MRFYYRSRRNILLGIGIWGLVFFLMSLSFQESFSIQRILDSPATTLSCLCVLLFLGGIWFGTGYRIKEEFLIIKIGPIIERKINIHSINSIERSYDLIASPANDLKRLRLNYEDSYVLISPVSEKEFLNHLKSINPEIVIYNLEKTIKF